MMMKIQHKNIVKYLTSFSDDSTNTVCIIMEYCGNLNLRDIFQRKEFLKSLTNEKNVCLLIRNLASALHFHQQDSCYSIRIQIRTVGPFLMMFGHFFQIKSKAWFVCQLFFWYFSENLENPDLSQIIISIICYKHLNGKSTKIF